MTGLRLDSGVNVEMSSSQNTMKSSEKRWGKYSGIKKIYYRYR